MQPSLAAEIELSHDSVLGIMDFRYAPYALGDTFTWLTNLQIVAHENRREHIDIALVTLPYAPSSRLQRQITGYNYIQSVEGLFPAFLCCPKLRSVRIYERAYPAAQRILAVLAGMSPSSFHRHFRAVTSMSPLQFQKKIRLAQARALLAADAGDVAGVGHLVGYDSPTQFSREYRRMFGAPPRRDAARGSAPAPLLP